MTKPFPKLPNPFGACDCEECRRARQQQPGMRLHCPDPALHRGADAMPAARKIVDAMGLDLPELGGSAEDVAEVLAPYLQSEAPGSWAIRIGEIQAERDAAKAINVALMRSENELQARLAKVREIAVAEGRSPHIRWCLLCGQRWHDYDATENHHDDCPARPPEDATQ